MIAVLLDRRPEYLSGADPALSLLTLPLASSSVLDQLASRILNALDGALLVLPLFDTGPAYAQRVAESTAFGVRIIEAEQLVVESKAAEPSENLLVLDAARWPVDGFDLEDILRRHRTYRGATHAVAVGADAERTRERVECDAQGFVKRIQRLYNRVTWPEAANSGLFLSIVPARALGEIRFQSLPELRSELAERGVLTCDDPNTSDLIELTSEEGFLAVHERMVAQAARPDAKLGFSIRAPNVLVGEGARVDPSARFKGPIMIYPGAAIDAGVTIIGPTVIGARSHVQRGAVLAQCVLAMDTIIPPETTICHRIASGTFAPAVRAETRSVRIKAPLAPIGGYQATDDDRTLHPATSTDASVNSALKRMMDLILSFVGLLLLSPLLILFALLVKLDSRGPILFGHRREQKGGKEFSCLKFRTMVTGADRLQRTLAQRNEVDGPQFKMRDDPRVTRMGRILRATNIDELPQLINVLLGQMSLVGPRPSPFRENQICVPWRRARLSVSPGITGLWQICRGNRDQADFNQWIYYDIMYVRNLSVWLDVKVLLATVLTLGGKWSVPLSWVIPTPSGFSPSEPVAAA